MSRREDERPLAEPGSEAETARVRTEQGIERLLEGLIQTCFDWIRKKRRPVTDTARLQQAADQGLAAMVRYYRTAMAYQGLEPAEVDRRMRWPAGRTARVLVRPWELRFGEEIELADVLGFQVDQCFGPRDQP